MDLQGKSAVVTGGGNGIGRAIALAFADKGANVAVADIELDAADAVAAEVRERGVKSLAVAVDVTKPEDVDALADSAWDAFGSVEVLVNNAGVMAAGPLADAPPRDFEWVFAVNVGGVLNGIRSFAPRFVASGAPAWIVNTGSEHSLGVPHLGAGIYTASKHAVHGLTDVLRGELPEHVGVSLLCPGIVESTLWRASERRQDAHGGAEAANEANAAAMQLGMPAADVAQRVVEGIEAESFYIMTHAHVVQYAERRAEAVAEAFAAQAPRYDGDEAYSVENIIQKLQGG